MLDKDAVKYPEPKVVVVVLNWNQPQDTLQCLASLKSVAYRCLEVVVIDNGSQDGSTNIISRHFPEFALLPQQNNLGFAGGSNVGIQWGLDREADHILLLNNDTVVHPAFLTFLVDFMDSKPAAGIVTPKIYVYDDPKTIWALGGRINRHTSRSRHIAEGEIDTGQFADPIACDYATGCAMFVRRAVLERIGLLDTDYFYSYEDADFSIRARDAGFGVYCVPQARIWHKGAASVQGLRSASYRYYASRNRIIFVRKRGKGIRRVGGVVYISVKVASYMAYYALARPNVRILKALLWAVRDGLLGRCGVSPLD